MTKYITFMQLGMFKTKRKKPYLSFRGTACKNYALPAFILQSHHMGPAGTKQTSKDYQDTLSYWNNVTRLLKGAGHSMPISSPESIFECWGLYRVEVGHVGYVQELTAHHWHSFHTLLDRLCMKVYIKNSTAWAAWLTKTNHYVLVQRLQFNWTGCRQQKGF